MPSRKRKLDSTGAITMEKSSAPSRAKATVQAMGLNSRPSTLSRVKIGRDAVVMSPNAKNTGRWTSWAGATGLGVNYFPACFAPRGEHNDRTKSVAAGTISGPARGSASGTARVAHGCAVHRIGTKRRRETEIPFFGDWKADLPV